MKWDKLPTSVCLDGMKNFLEALGDASADFVIRCDEDPEFIRLASEAMRAFIKHVPKIPNARAPERPNLTILDIKQLMGSRCFLAEEVASLYEEMTQDELGFLPVLDQIQLNRLWDFLHAPCPILKTLPAHRTHVLFPMPAIMNGRDVNIELLTMLWSGEGLRGIHTYCQIQFVGHRDPSLPKWYLFFLGPDHNPAVPQTVEGADEAAQIALLPQGYSVVDPTLLIMMMSLWKRRGQKLPSNDEEEATAWLTDAIGMNSNQTDEERVVVSHGNGSALVFAMNVNPENATRLYRSHYSGRTDKFPLAAARVVD